MNWPGLIAAITTGRCKRRWQGAFRWWKNEQPGFTKHCWSLCPSLPQSHWNNRPSGAGKSTLLVDALIRFCFGKNRANVLVCCCWTPSPFNLGAVCFGRQDTHEWMVYLSNVFIIGPSSSMDCIKSIEITDRSAQLFGLIISLLKHWRRTKRDWNSRPGRCNRGGSTLRPTNSNHESRTHGNCRCVL